MRDYKIRPEFYDVAKPDGSDWEYYFVALLLTYSTIGTLFYILEKVYH